jgi:hypothetical protein
MIEIRFPRPITIYIRIDYQNFTYRYSVACLHTAGFVRKIMKDKNQELTTYPSSEKRKKARGISRNMVTNSEDVTTTTTTVIRIINSR